jgi:hypothetical protein
MISRVPVIVLPHDPPVLHEEHAGHDPGVSDRPATEVPFQACTDASNEHLDSKQLLEPTSL